MSSYQNSYQNSYQHSTVPHPLDGLAGKDASSPTTSNLAHQQDTDTTPLVQLPKQSPPAVSKPTTPATPANTESEVESLLLSFRRAYGGQPVYYHSMSRALRSAFFTKILIGTVVLTFIFTTLTSYASYSHDELLSLYPYFGAKNMASDVLLTTMGHGFVLTLILSWITLYVISKGRILLIGNLAKHERWLFCLRIRSVFYRSLVFGIYSVLLLALPFIALFHVLCKTHEHLCDVPGHQWIWIRVFLFTFHASLLCPLVFVSAASKENVPDAIMDVFQHQRQLEAERNRTRAASGV